MSGAKCGRPHTAGGKWLFREHGVWKHFDPVGQQAVETAFQRGDTSVQTTFFNPRLKQDVVYVYDLKAMSQVNTATGFTREIRREENHAQAAGTHITRSLGHVASKNCTLNYTVGRSNAAGSDFRTVTGCKMINPDDLMPDEVCSICMCEFDAAPADFSEACILMSKCTGHYFHGGCVDNQHCFKQGFVKCPVCKTAYGTELGPQPSGTMHIVKRDGLSCGGFANIDTWEIQYQFGDGLQAASMPNPGQPYSGTMRVAYLPDTNEGREVLELLKVCFQRGLTFAVGQSVTTGRDNTTVWNGVHHKTSLTGGSSNFGYPDADYFRRVKEELAQKGVK